MYVYNYKAIKAEISESLEQGQYDKARELIKENKLLFKDDPDFYVLEARFYALKNNLKLAKNIILRGLKINRMNFGLLYAMWKTCFSLGEYCEAFNYFMKAFVTNEEAKTKYKELSIEEAIDMICNKIEETKLSPKEKKQIYVELLNEVKVQQEEYETSNYTYFPDKTKGSVETFLGDWVECNGEDYYVGYYGCDDRIKTIDQRALRFYVKCEIFKARKSRVYQGGVEGIKSLVPVAYLKENTTLKITEEETGKTYEANSCNYDGDRLMQYQFYKISGKYTLSSDNEVAVGEPILLKKDHKKKDLVLSIFVDGLSYSYLENEGLEKLMPHTARFFADGMQCINHYTTGDWTLPAAAALCTGLYTPQHKVFHPRMKSELPKDYTSLFEIFKKEGYTTAKIDGVYRITPTYGYVRGIDRTIYQPSYIHMDGKEIVMEAIRHMETFKDTNQYMWLGFMDTHDASSEEHRSILQQSHMELGDRKKVQEEKTKSVYQSYSPTKIARYKVAIQELDIYLSILFSYIQANFDPEKVVVSLVSDHGQAYLVKCEDRLLEEERTKVPMMFKGYKHGTCSDMTDLTDYLPMLLDAVGIQDEYAPLRDGQIPKCLGGEQEKKYAYSEEIYPGNIYEACLRSKEHKVNFQNLQPVPEDGRVPINEKFILAIKDRKTGEVIDDEALYEYYYNEIANHLSKCRIY